RVQWPRRAPAVLGLVVVLGLVAGRFAPGASAATVWGPDPAFGTNGTVRLAVHDAADDVGRAVVVLSDGTQVEAGGSGGDVALLRYDPATGTLVSSFGRGGSVVADLGDDDEADAMVVDAQGRFTVAGRS